MFDEQKIRDLNNLTAVCSNYGAKLSPLNELCIDVG
jgi:hypothetical protein